MSEPSWVNLVKLVMSEPSRIIQAENLVEDGYEYLTEIGYE